MGVDQTSDGRWYCYYQHEGRQKKEYFGRGPGAKQEAEARDLEIKLAKKRGQRVVRPSGVHLDDLAQVYLDHAKAQGRSERWRKEWAQVLNGHILPLLAHRPVEQLEYTDILRVSDYYADRSLGTRNRYLGYLRAIFRFGVEQGITTHNPMAKWRKAREARRPVYLTVPDLTRIYEAAEPHLQWGIEVEWELGTRPGVTELLGLKWADVDFEASVIHVRGSKTEGADRLIPITPDFRSRLLERRETAQSDHIIEFKGKPIKKFRRSFQTAARRAGIAYDVRMYDVRHLFISVSLAGGADLEAVAKIVGHASTKMTADTYLHLQQGEKERAVTLRPSIRQKRAGKLVKIR